MKIQINATTRLKAAQADEDQARSYLKSLGVEVGALETRSDNYIQFMIRFKSFDLVKNKLTKKLGREQVLLDEGGITQLRWTIRGKGFVTLYKNQFNEADVAISNDPRRATASRMHAAKDDNGDQERLDQLTKQIRMFEEDVKEIEDDGDDATVERKHLESLRDEQRRLKEKMGISHASRRT